MALNIKFTFGQQVWFYDQGLPMSGKVAAITACPRRKVYRVEITQWGKEEYRSFDEEGLFGSKAELAAGLLKQAEKLIGVA